MRRKTRWSCFFLAGLAKFITAIVLGLMLKLTV